MTPAHGQARRVTTPVEFYFPPPGVTTVATAAIGGNQDVLRLGLRRWPPSLPPRPHGRHGKGGRIMIDADADPATVMRHVIDTRGKRCAQALIHKIMPPDLLGNPLG